MSAVTVTSLAGLLVACGTSDVATKTRAGVGTTAAPRLARLSPAERPRGARADCSMRSQARFPGAFADTRNLVIGPLVLVGGAESTSPSAIREFGGQKFAVLLTAGHRVTVQIADGARTFAGLEYVPRPHQSRRRTLSGADRAVTFVSCRPGQRSGSSADGAPVTFWSGFVVTRVPICLPLDVYVDDRSSARRVVLSLGAPCSG
jgi:hypothetical protein